MTFASPGENMLYDLVYYILCHIAFFLVPFESYIASARNVYGLQP